ncbi:MAG: low molecular weight phosphotyrosine protein phosphatase [Oscillospiraceae bacterium]|nr:low molecular weight phosphotyrosine protein phosphatase [Oscillospiraceae bacterium]
MIKIMFVCHGNICRSPMAEFVMKNIVRKNGDDGRFYICSAATSNEEIGHDIHRGTKQILKEKNIPFHRREAVRLTKNDYEKYDYIIGMDSYNFQNILKIFGCDPEEKVHLLLSFADIDRNIADPWYTNDFECTYNDILKGCTALYSKLK